MGTIAELRAKINQGISLGLQKFSDKYKTDMEKYALKAESQYYNDYSSWYDSYRRYDIKNMHEVTSEVSNRNCTVKTNFSASHMHGGHGFSALHTDPEQVFTWGFETGNHGWYVGGTPVRTYWEVYYNNLKSRAKPWAVRFITQGLKSVGL